MKQRPWMPVAVVLLLLLGGTVGAGFWLRGRLDDASAVLEPMLEPALAQSIGQTVDLGVPVCGDEDAIVGDLRAFHDAVASSQAEAEATGAEVPELSATRVTFDSFLLESATARIAVGKLTLVVSARPADGTWCVDATEFTTEE